MNTTFVTHSSEETILFATKLVDKLSNGTTIILNGDLGAGKTTFVRGLAKGLHINEVIQSPTFNIMKLYLKGDRPLIHIDAYRLADINTDIGLDEFIGFETGITVIEWPEFIKDLIPETHIEINIKHLGEDDREITFSTKGSGWESFEL